VAYALRLGSDDGRPVVAEVKIGLGGVAATPVRALDTEAALAGRPWTRDTVVEAAEVLGGEGTPINDHRASANYRAATLRTSLLKFFAANPAARQEVPA
jgi:xanthine dehydrogenase small subunit